MRKLGIAAVTVMTLGAGYVTARTAFAQAPEPGTGEAPQGRWFDVLTLAGPGSEIGAVIAEVEQTGVSASKPAAPEGVVVREVRSGSPAGDTGLRAGDVIISFDGERVRSVRQFTRLVRETPPGRNVAVTVARDGARTELQVRPRLPEPQRFSFDALREPLVRGLPFGAWQGPATLGVTIQEMTPELTRFFGATDGVLVTRVDAGSPAERAGIRVGDVITLVAGRSIEDGGDLARELRNADGEVGLTVVRDKRPMTLTATLSSARRQSRGGVRR